MLNIQAFFRQPDTYGDYKQCVQTTRDALALAKLIKPLTVPLIDGASSVLITTHLDHFISCVSFFLNKWLVLHLFCDLKEKGLLNKNLYIFYRQFHNKRKLSN